LLKPLNDCAEEKMVVAICFFIGAIDNTMYGLAQNKSTVYAAVALSALTGMAFPTISAIKANNVVCYFFTTIEHAVKIFLRISLTTGYFHCVGRIRTRSYPRSTVFSTSACVRNWPSALENRLQQNQRHSPGSWCYVYICWRALFSRCLRCLRPSEGQGQRQT
jgi:hypothetical protein